MRIVLTLEDSLKGLRDPQGGEHTLKTADLVNEPFSKTSVHDLPEAIKVTVGRERLE